MLIDRETLYNGLFDLLRMTPGFASYYRRWMPMKQLGTANLPALMMREWEENVDTKFGSPPKYTIRVLLGIAVSTPASMLDSVPSSFVNPLIDALEKQIAPTQPFLQIIGLSSVSRIFIEGKIEIEEAVMNDMSFALIPLTIVCT